MFRAARRSNNDLRFPHASRSLSRTKVARLRTRALPVFCPPSLHLCSKIKRALARSKAWAEQYCPPSQGGEAEQHKTRGKAPRSEPRLFISPASQWADEKKALAGMKRRSAGGEICCAIVSSDGPSACTPPSQGGEAEQHKTRGKAPRGNRTQSLIPRAASADHSLPDALAGSIAGRA